MAQPPRHPATDSTVKLLDVVALAEDLPQAGLVRGEVGTVVEMLDDGAVEVEFVDRDGRTYAQEPIHASKLIRLVYRGKVA
jgi:hypothetical protein